MDTSFLAQAKYGGVKVGAVAGVWSITLAVACATLFAFLTNRRRLANPVDTLNKGTLGSMLPMLNTASEVGYGGVIASLAAFGVVRDGIRSLTSDPVISIAITVNVLAPGYFYTERTSRIFDDHELAPRFTRRIRT